MESVLLGIAAPAAAGTAGSVIERTLQTAAEPFAALLHAFTSAMTPGGDDSELGAIEGLSDNLEALSNELATRIKRALIRAGVDSTEPIEIRVSPVDGRLEVVGDHPQKALIEAALADDSGLADEFEEAAAIDLLLTAIADEKESTETVELGYPDQGSITATFTAEGESAELKLN